VKIEPERVKLKNLHCYKPLPVNGLRQQAEKDLSGVVVICELHRLAVHVVPSRVYKWSIPIQTPTYDNTVIIKGK
jgi:hypothetical protein